MDPQNPILILALVFFLILTIGAVGAQQTYSIGMLGFRWQNFTIFVQIPSNPSWAHDEIANALRVWNTAQQWFVATYFPGKAMYTLAEPLGASAGDVAVHFVQSESTFQVDCPTTETGRAAACADQTDVWFDMTLFSAYSGYSPTDMLHIAVHEFGHVLGLDHTSTPIDLMCGDPYYCPDDTYNDLSPSTLDLYALHLLASYSGNYYYNTTVTLPSSIPYRVNVPITMPEFGNPTVAVIPSSLALSYLDERFVTITSILYPIGKLEFAAS